VLAVGTEKQFRELCKVLGAPQIAVDERFANNHQRVKNRQLLKEILQQYISNIGRDDLLDQLTQQRVPAGSIRDMQEVFMQPDAQKMILSYVLDDGTIAKCVRTAAFDITPVS
jgi:crotonobetainyl-CoA:carnitine CoA-transferase CaiB-like acyl-CoA transferase